jgi:hypothetical protein
MNSSLCKVVDWKIDSTLEIASQSELTMYKSLLIFLFAILLHHRTYLTCPVRVDGCIRMWTQTSQ